MNNLFLRIQFHWDWWIYCRAYNSIRRLCEGNRSLAYLMRLWLDDWIERNPVTEGQKDSAWDIYRSMKGLKND